jgi:hypothetical protein
MKTTIRRLACCLVAIILFIPAAIAGTVMVATPDGAQLATDVHLPQGEGPFPVVLIRTPYNKEPTAQFAKTFTDRGFACVVQDVRGNFASKGRFMGFADDGWGERQDGKTTLTWIRNQPWCNGKVGTWGPSALGITQVMLGGTGADVTCQFIQVAASNFYDQLAYQGGVFRKNLAEKWLQSRSALHVVDIWKSHPTYDDFWIGHNAEARAPEVTAPAVHLGGWFDIFAKGTINNFTSRHYHGGKTARGNQILIIGPWPHGIVQKFGELKFPDNFNFNHRDVLDRFFDHWLKGEDTGIMAEPPVHYYTIGDGDDAHAPGNEWRTAQGWPPFETRPTRYLLAKDGKLTTDPKQIQNDTVSYDYDPKEPCPTHGGANLGLPPLKVGPFDQRQVAHRPDVLTFATAPLEKPIEITGALRLKLYVSSSAPDTDFTAKFLDIYPDGRQILMTDNIQRLKLRNGLGATDPLPPGAVGELDVDLWMISLIFNKGHRIGVQISSSNYPRFEKNPNTGDDFPVEDHYQIARNTIHIGPTHPSGLILPVRPAD